MNIPSTLPAATSFSPSSTVTCALRKSFVSLTNGLNVSRTSCSIPRNLPLKIFQLISAPLVGERERNTDRQFRHQTDEHIARE